MSNQNYKWLTKIFGYLRTSGEVNPVHSIPTQKRQVEIYAKNNGLEIIEFLIDEKKTGLNQNREGFQKLLGLVEKDLVEVIIVPYFDRIGRNQFEVSLFLMKLKNKGIECISVGENKKLSLMGEQEIVQAAINADVENRNRTERILSSKDESLRKGEFIYDRVPLGYKRDPNRHLIIDQNATLVKDIFDKFIELKSINKLAKNIKNDPS